MFSCDICSRTFTEKHHLNRHKRGHEEEKKFNCGKCNKSFKRKDARQRHEKNCNGEKKQQQPPKTVGSGVRRNLVPTPPSNNNFDIAIAQTAFAKAAITWKLKYPRNDGAEYINLLNQSVTAMKGHITQYHQERHALKFNMSLHVNFEKATDPEVTTEPPIVFVSEQMEVYENTDIDELLTICSEQLQNRIEVYEMTGSGWIISELMELDTTVWQLDPLRASTYHSLPT